MTTTPWEMSSASTRAMMKIWGMHATAWIFRTDKDTLSPNVKQQALNSCDWKCTPHPKIKYVKNVKNCPVRDVNGTSTLIAVEKSGVSAREKPRMLARLPCAASTTRGATQCQSSVMTRGSHLDRLVTNTNNRFQVTFYYTNKTGLILPHTTTFGMQISTIPSAYTQLLRRSFLNGVCKLTLIFFFLNLREKQESFLVGVSL